jgi:hypothetical protein
MSLQNVIEDADQFADFDSLTIRELKLQPAEADQRLRLNDQKASIIGIFLIVLL